MSDVPDARRLKNTPHTIDVDVTIDSTNHPREVKHLNPAVATFYRTCQSLVDVHIVDVHIAPLGLLWYVYRQYVSLSLEYSGWKQVNAFWRFLDNIQRHHVLRHTPTERHASRILIYERSHAGDIRNIRVQVQLHFMPRCSRTVLHPAHQNEFTNFLIDRADADDSLTYTAGGQRTTLMFTRVGTMETRMRFRHQLQTIGRTHSKMDLYDATHLYDVYKSSVYQRSVNRQEVQGTSFVREVRGEASFVRIALCHLAIACRVLRPGGTYMFELRISRTLMLTRSIRELLLLCREAFGRVRVYRSVYAPPISYYARLMCVCSAYTGTHVTREERLLNIIDRLAALPVHQRVFSVLRIAEPLTSAVSPTPPARTTPTPTPLPPEWDAECDRLEAHIRTNSRIVTTFATFANTYMTPYLSNTTGAGQDNIPPHLMSRIRHYQRRLAMNFVRRLFHTKEHPVPLWTLSDTATTSRFTTQPTSVIRVFIIDIPGVSGTQRVLADVRAAALRTRTTADAWWFWNATRRVHVVVQSCPYMMANMYPTNYGNTVCLALIDHPYRRLLNNLKEVFHATKDSIWYTLKMFWAIHNVTNRKQFFRTPVMICKQLLNNKCFASQTAYCTRNTGTGSDTPVDCVRMENGLRKKLAVYTGCATLGSPTTNTPLPPSLTTAEANRIQQLYAEDFAFTPVFLRMFAPSVPYSVYVASGLQDGSRMSSFLLGEGLPLMMYLREIGAFRIRHTCGTPCVIHIWRPVTATTSPVASFSAQHHQEAQQDIYDDISAYHHYTIRYVIHTSTTPPLLHTFATYHELPSYEHQRWLHVATTTRATQLRAMCTLLVKWANALVDRSDTKTTVKRRGAAGYATAGNTAGHMCGGGGRLRRSRSSQPPQHKITTLRWPQHTTNHTHASRPLHTSHKWHEWIATLGKVQECILPAPEWCKLNPRGQAFADFSSLHWLLFLKTGTSVRWASSIRNPWSGTKLEWLQFLRSVFLLCIPQLPPLSTLVPATPTTPTAPTARHRTHTFIQKHQKHTVRATTRSCCSHQVPTLPILCPDNRSKHSRWHIYYESVYHHPVSERVDLNTFTWFYNNAPFEQPVCPRVRRSKVFSSSIAPVASPQSPDWMGDVSLSVYPHKDRHDRQQLRLQPNDAFTGHLPTFPMESSKPMNVVTLYGFFVKRKAPLLSVSCKVKRKAPLLSVSCKLNRAEQRQEVIRIAEDNDASMAAWFWCVRGSGVFWDMSTYLQGRQMVRVHNRSELAKRFAKWLPPDTHKTFDTIAKIDAFDSHMPQLLREVAVRETGVRAVQIEQAHGIPELFVIDRVLSPKSSLHPPTSDSSAITHTQMHWGRTGALQLNIHPPASPSIHVNASAGVRASFLSTGDTNTPIRPVRSLPEERLITSLPPYTDTPPWLTNIQHECLQRLRTYSHHRTTDTRALQEWCQQYSPQEMRQVLNTWIPSHQRITISSDRHKLQYVDICCTPFGIAAIMGCPLTVLRVLLQHGATTDAPCPPLLYGRLLRFISHTYSSTTTANHAIARHTTRRRRRNVSSDSGAQTRNNTHISEGHPLTVSLYLRAILDSVNSITMHRKRVLLRLLGSRVVTD